MSSEAAEAPRLYAAAEAVAWLRSQGFKVAKTKFYDDAATGKIGRTKEGLFQEEALRAYQLHCKRLEGESPRKVSERLLKERAENENRNIKANADLRELQYQRELGRLLPRAQVEEEWAAAFQLLKSSFEAWSHDAADRIVELVRGDPDRHPELLRYLLEATEDYFAQFAEEREWTVEVGEE